MKNPKVICETPVYKVILVHEANVPVPAKIITGPDIAAKIAGEYLRGADREHFGCCYSLPLKSEGGLNDSL